LKGHGFSRALSKQDIPQSEMRLPCGGRHERCKRATQSPWKYTLPMIPSFGYPYYPTIKKS
jgi:hypothetical protein